MKEKTQIIEAYMVLISDHDKITQESRENYRQWQDMHQAEARGRIQGFVGYYSLIIGMDYETAKEHLDSLI